MKKVLYTTLAGVALLGAVAPLATTVSAYDNVTQGVANAGKVGSKEYAAALGELQVLENHFTQAGQNKVGAEISLERAQAALVAAQADYQAKVDAAKNALDTVRAERANAMAIATSATGGPSFTYNGTPVVFTGEVASARVELVEATFNPAEIAAEAAFNAAVAATEAVEAAKASVATEEANVANATAAYNDARAAYEAQFAKVEALYNTFRANDPNAAAEVEAPKKAEENSSNTQNSTGTASDKGTSAPKSVKVVDTAKGEKTLPKTSAVK
ncbi:hypothetical protein [Streptococcus acidominimus]|uniref:Uncharacterized protein n=1 Tax=Streptococcus acidominimus TaxID=1326 RepID=A0A1Q8ECQ7_STRAI|nr:hypothetical protein [Streptococcus acidominimus]MBF0848673.1 hypothetical protein [Streptococcus danieliae]MBF0818084.1 hypothetical protein [Streptococcus acidominimus]MBF0837861.1 hypothetical protein [Streptococcus acidominimus]OLF49576.1 hypothetical protein BU200_06425 [Streptococcus acidominimus]TFU31602.1 hypothetical protein E4U01_01255 [Streptococcus acidominimus]